jgi:predicted HTH transcriptional regulator
MEPRQRLTESRISPPDTAHMNNPEQQRLTIEDIHALIRSRTEESLTLEYKAAAALALTGKRDFRDEISKDVSSMANSAGGRIIYGVSADPINSWFPGELDPVERSSITTETLHQIISSRIQPTIQGVNIYAITVTEERLSMSSISRRARPHIKPRTKNITNALTIFPERWRITKFAT